MLTILFIHLLLVIISFAVYTYRIVTNAQTKDHWLAAIVIFCPIMNMIYIYHVLHELFFPQFKLLSHIIPALKALGVLIGFVILFGLLGWFFSVIPMWLVIVIDSFLAILLFIHFYKSFKK